MPRPWPCTPTWTIPWGGGSRPEDGTIYMPVCGTRLRTEDLQRRAGLLKAYHFSNPNAAGSKDQLDYASSLPREKGRCYQSQVGQRTTTRCTASIIRSIARSCMPGFTARLLQAFKGEGIILRPFFLLVWVLFFFHRASLAFWWRLWLFGFSGFCGFLASVAFWLRWPFGFLRLVFS